MDQFSKLGPVQAIVKFWGTLTGTQRFISVVFISTSIVLLSVVSVVATKPRMEVLFSGLAQADAGAVVSKLQERGVKYELTDGGTVIKVPEKDVHETRLALATAGLPAGGNVGFEIFDKANFGMTEFSQKLNYQRALQGELARTINTLDMVQEARVHISIPEDTVFTKEQQDKYATASVVVKLRPGGQLGSDQVGGIVHLVSAAVQGLKPGHVTVVDTQGNILNEAGDDATGLDPRLSASQMSLKSNEEQRIERDLQSMLDRVVGPNKAVVRVNAKMNFDRRETSSELYNPGGSGTGLLVTESKTDETYGGGAGGARVSTPVATGQGYHRTETNNKYQVSRTTEHVIKSPGSIEQLSIAVMVDDKVDAARIPTIQKAVEAAVGADAARGDKVTVESVPFDNSAAQKEEKEMTAMASKSSYLNIGKTVGGVLLLFGFLFFLKKTLGSVKISVTEPEPGQMVAGKVAVAEGRGPSHAEGGAILQGVGDKRPEEVAQVIKSWISES